MSKNSHDDDELYVPSSSSFFSFTFAPLLYNPSSSFLFSRCLPPLFLSSFSKPFASVFFLFFLFFFFLPVCLSLCVAPSPSSFFYCSIILSPFMASRTFLIPA
jgi:hypothetical protein